MPCASCHINNNYTTLPTTCIGCHQTDFTGTTNPPHVSSGFPTDCTLCHTTTTWTTSTFNHASVFPLTGAHATTACAACHTNNNYTTLPTTCYGCHQTDYTGTNNPPHAASGFPTTCETCHTTTAWTGAVFNHNNTTFPLTGAHTTVPCASCHVNNNYTTLPTTVIGCHQADFNGTTNPAHVSAGFPTDCTLCHYDDQLDYIDVQSLIRVPAGGRAHHAGLRPVPHQQQLHNRADHLHRLPPGGLQWHHESEPRSRGFPTTCTHATSKQRRGQRAPPSTTLYTRTVRADRRPHHPAMRAVPHQQQLRQPVHRLLLVPPGGLHRHHQPEPRHLGLPDRLLDVPLDHQLDDVDLQPQHHGVPADRRAHDPASARSATPSTTTTATRPTALATAATRRITTAPPTLPTPRPASPPLATRATRPPTGLERRSTTTTRRSR